MNISNEVYYDYFMYHGKKYPLNTVFIPTKEFKYRFNFPRDKMLLIEHSYNKVSGKEWYTIVYGHDEFGTPRYRKVSEIPEEWIQDIAGFVDPNEKHYVYDKDKDVDEVVYTWVIYIALMLFIALFNGRIVGWIALSVYFFTWRKKKLRREKEYDY